MKFLLVAFLIAIAGTLIYLRLRPYLAVARRIFGVVRTAQRLHVNDLSASAPRAPAQTNESLVRCATCGTWLPASGALVFRPTKAVYCSPDCIERAAAGAPRKKASGNG